MKSIYRSLMNKALAGPLSRLEGKILDLAAGPLPSYRKLLPVETTSITAADLRGGVGVAPIDFDKPLPFDDGAFDAILFINAVYIAQDPASTLKELRRVLKREGTLILVSPLIFPETREPHDYHRWTSEGLEGLCRRAGFARIKIATFGGHFTSSLFLIEPFLRFRTLKWLGHVIAQSLDKVVPKRYAQAHPCPLGYLAVCTN